MSSNKLGRYELIRVLGQGAMGLVFEGRDPNLDRRVAIKTIRVESLSPTELNDYEFRFRTEARSAARLQHPNIVSVYDSERDGDVAYLVMEHIQGEDLKHYLDRGARYTLDESLRIIGDLLTGLGYAHQQGVIHRDVKPANLLIEANGRVKLTDFGVARIQGMGDQTRTKGSIVGTLRYMSPEQVQGLNVDAGADLFSTAVVLYQLLTGERPFNGDNDFAIIHQIIDHHPPAPSSINALLPPALDAVLAKALAKSRDDRFGSAQEFLSALQDAIYQASDRTIVPPAGRQVVDKLTTPGGSYRLKSTPGMGVTLPSDGSAPSVVVQEMELVYWKDIKDTHEIEDLIGFLDRFPDGVYAGLAQRRLHKLNARAQGAFDQSDLAPLMPDLPLATPSSTRSAPRPPTPLPSLPNPLPSLQTRSTLPEAPLTSRAKATPLVESTIDQLTALKRVIGGAEVRLGTDVSVKLSAQAATPNVSKAVASLFSSPKPTSRSATRVEVNATAKTPSKVPSRVNSKPTKRPPEDSAFAVTTLESMEDDHFARRNERDAGEALKSLRSNNAEKKRGDGAANRQKRLPWGLIVGAALVIGALIGGIAWVGKSQGDKAKLPGAASAASALADEASTAGNTVSKASVTVGVASSLNGTVPFAESLVPGESPAATAPAAKAGSGAVLQSAALSNAGFPGSSLPSIAASGTGKPVLTSAERAKAVSAAKAASAAAARDAVINSVSNNAIAPIAPIATPVVEPPASRPPPAAAASTSVVRASGPASSPPPAHSATEACQGRILLGFDSCMAEQCAKPGAALQPACIERREMERRRREREEARSF